MSITHVIISPHPDDAVLSLGPCMSRWRRDGKRVIVVTVFDGGPDRPLSRGAIEDRERYDGDPVVMRRLEDVSAVACLDAELISLGLPELLYRWRTDGRPRCEYLADIYGPPEPGDESTVALIADALAASVLADWLDAVVHAPVGMGNHIDHVLARRAAERTFERVILYEDLPYVIRENRVPAVDWQGIASVDVEAWLGAIREYRSQLPIIWETDPHWVDTLHKWATRKAGRPL